MEKYINKKKIIIELGSGNGCIKKILKKKNIILTDIVKYPWIDKKVDMLKINLGKKFINKVDVVTFEFENIPYDTLEYINKIKNVYPKPSINKILQNRFYEKNFVNKLGIKTTDYILVNNKKDIISNSKKKN